MHYSKMDLVMKRNKITTARLAETTGLSLATVRSLRYGYRQLAKTETETALKIASALGVKLQTIL
ncbi:MAG: helix-turn-helix transcriptional regulator [Bacilli bacterium]|nr:helix-turn-helix transcriptional regulator [Bacilli bacterium]